MVVYISSDGRLANKLWMAVKLLVVHLEYGIPVLYPSFDVYRSCFTATEKHGFILTNSGMTAGFRCLSNIAKLLCRFYCHTSSYNKDASTLVYIDDLCRGDARSIAIINGWLKLSDNALYAKYKKNIQRFFSPCDIFRSVSKAVIDKARRESELVIGVHIRRSDYSKWENGIYYYDDEHYRHYMDQVSSLFPRNNISFIICSDEAVSMGNFAEYKIFEASNHFVEDLYTLAMCDYIMGPPSTYSAWASFYGEVPLYRIGIEKNRISQSDFAIVNG